MKIDFHVHSLYSEDSFQSFKDIIRVADNRGLDGVVIADHNTIAGADELIAAWNDYYKQLDKKRITVIRAGEYSTEEGHIMILGLKHPIENQLKLNGQWYKAREVVEAARAQDAVVILAHPYRNKHREPSEWLLENIDAIEAFNGRNCFLKNNFDANEKAVRLADRLGLPVVAGSDGHMLSEIGKSYVDFKVSAEEFDFRKLHLYSSDVYGSWSHPAFEVVSQVYKFFNRKKWKPIFKQMLKLIYGILIYAYAVLFQDKFKKGYICSYKSQEDSN